jgi:putative ABC transport system substrate-binding protein
MPALRRREFITLLGGAAVVWPIAARGQQTGAMRRVAFLHGLAESDPEVQARIAAFREGLEFLGWVQDRNIQIEHRFASGDIARIRQYVAELVNSPPDVIAATGTPVLAALKEATSLS